MFLISMEAAAILPIHNLLLNLEDYIIIPENKKHSDILIYINKPFNRSLLGKNWYEAHETLQEYNHFMPNMIEFLDLVKLLKSNKKIYNGKGRVTNSKNIADEVLTKREPLRGTWLDAYFAEVNETMHIFYDHRKVHGKLMPMKSEPLEKCIRRECYASLLYTNEQGLPIITASKEETHFYPPEDNSVAGFEANSDGVWLGCNGNPRYSNPGLGVYAARLRED